MEPVTMEDRKKELHMLLEQIQSHPSRDWSQERERIVVLQQMIGAEEKNKRDA